MQTYDKAFIYLGGKLLADPNFEVQTASHSLSYDVPADDNLTAFFADVRRLAPVRPEGVVTLSMPWGILGTIKVPAVVQGVTHKGGAAVPSTTTMEGTLDDRALRREIANAVRRAIVNRASRESVLLGVRTKDGARVLAMANQIIGRWNDSRPRYRGERKQRKAMRRLLRAAGITRPAP